MNKRAFFLKLLPQSLSIRMASTMENIDRANKETREFLKKHGLDSISFPICLGMREALINAVQHGSAGLSEALISYDIEIKNGRVILRIKDEGPGFDWQKPRKKPFDEEGGRGIHIMKAYFNSLKYNNRGNLLTLEFFIK